LPIRLPVVDRARGRWTRSVPPVERLKAIREAAFYGRAVGGA